MVVTEVESSLFPNLPARKADFKLKYQKKNYLENCF